MKIRRVLVSIGIAAMVLGFTGCHNRQERETDIAAAEYMVEVPETVEALSRERMDMVEGETEEIKWIEGDSDYFRASELLELEE